MLRPDENGPKFDIKHRAVKLEDAQLKTETSFFFFIFFLYIAKMFSTKYNTETLRGYLMMPNHVTFFFNY